MTVLAAWEAAEHRAGELGITDDCRARRCGQAASLMARLATAPITTAGDALAVACLLRYFDREGGVPSGIDTATAHNNLVAFLARLARAS